MKNLIRGVFGLVLIVGCGVLVRVSIENHQLEDQIRQLEAELGRMPIQDTDRVHLVEIENPYVPPEIASHLVRTWQFRCYLPPNYSFHRFSGDGRVAAEGLFHEGGYGRNSGSPNPESIHELGTLSLQRKGDHVVAFYAFGSSSSTISWTNITAEVFDKSVVIQPLVQSKTGPRSFDQDTILPMMKFYDLTTAKDVEVAGRTITTYKGAMIVLYPTSRESDFKELRSGKIPEKFDPGWIAGGSENE